MGETERSEKSTNIPEQLALSDCRISPVLFRFERVGAGSYRGAATTADVVNARWKSFREWYRFTGNEDDAEVGLSYHGARYYSPSLKRFISADPVTVHEAGSDINPYSYGYGNPTSYVDPDGREPILTALLIIGISMAIAGATNVTVQYATTGRVDWGWSGFTGAVVAGGVGALVGMGVGKIAAGILGNGFWGSVGAGAIGGAAGGAGAGATGTALAGGNATDVGNAALLGAVAGAVGGGTGVMLGSSSGGWTSVFASLGGAGAGTGAGLGFGAWAFDQKVTWETAGLSFATAVAGTMAGAGAREVIRAYRLNSVVEEIRAKMASTPDTEAGRNEVIRYAEERLEFEGVDKGAARYSEQIALDNPQAYGDCDPHTAAIRIGEKAFHEGAFKLAQTIVHENVHRRDFLRVGLLPEGEQLGAADPFRGETELNAWTRSAEFARDVGSSAPFGEVQSAEFTVKDIRAWQAGALDVPPF